MRQGNPFSNQQQWKAGDEQTRQGQEQRSEEGDDEGDDTLHITQNHSFAKKG